MSDDVSRILRSIALERGAPAHFSGVDFGFFLKNEGLFDYTGIKHTLADLKLGLRGRHQRANATLALAALELAAEQFPVRENDLRAGLETVRWPGRLEVMSDRPMVILDGAHNCEGVRALVDELRDLPPRRRTKLLFAAMADKEWAIMLRELATVIDEAVFTRVTMERSADPGQLAASFTAVPHRVVRDPKEALRTLVRESTDDEVIVVAGSLYLIGEIRPLAQELVKYPPLGSA